MTQMAKKNLRGIFFLVLWLTFSIVIIPLSLGAVTLTEEEVRAAVQTWVRYVTADARPDAVVEKMEPYAVDGEILSYIAHLSQGGFCLTGVDEMVYPVYLYSPSGTFDPKNPGYRYFLSEIGERTKTIRRESREGSLRYSEYREVFSQRALFWQELIRGRVPESARPAGTSMEAMEETIRLDLNSTWHQGSPYNDRCPVLTPPDERTLVGCVATALCQIMYYWKWPLSGTNTAATDYNYRWTNSWLSQPLANDPGIPNQYPWTNRLQWIPLSGLQMNGYWDLSLYHAAVNLSQNQGYRNALKALYDSLTPATFNDTINFGNETYNWGLMGDAHADPPNAGSAEVAKLCHHAGVAMGMNYGLTISTSGIYYGILPTALTQYFRYSPNVIVPETFDLDMLRGEIEWLRPVQMEGSDLNGVGHNWVVLGYRWSGFKLYTQFLINLGWGGSPAWYYLDEFGFPLGQYIGIRIAPLDVVRFVGNTTSGDGSPNSPHLNIEEALVSAPDYGTVIFKAGSINTYSADRLVIDRPLTLKGHSVVIQKQ